MSWHQWMEEPWFAYVRLGFVPIFWPVRWQGWAWYVGGICLLLPLTILMIEIGAQLEGPGFPVTSAIFFLIWGGWFAGVFANAESL